MKHLVPHYLKMIAWGLAIALQGQILFAEPIIYRVDIGSGPTNTAQADFAGDLRVVGTITADPELDEPILSSDLGLSWNNKPGVYSFWANDGLPSQDPNDWSVSSSELRFMGQSAVFSGGLLFSEWSMRLQASEPQVYISYGPGDSSCNPDPDRDYEDNIGAFCNHDLLLTFADDGNGAGFLVGTAVPEPSTGMSAIISLAIIVSLRKRQQCTQLKHPRPRF